jgi:hypothetical protein
VPRPLAAAVFFYIFAVPRILMLEPNLLAICANEHAPNAMFDIVQDAAGAWRLQGSLAGDIGLDKLGPGKG